MFQIASRVEEMIKNDNISNPQGVCRILEKEIQKLIEDYLILNKEIVVRFKKENGKNIFFLEFQADKIKNIGYLPYNGIV